MTSGRPSARSIRSAVTASPCGSAPDPGGSCRLRYEIQRYSDYDGRQSQRSLRPVRSSLLSRSRQTIAATENGRSGEIRGAFFVARAARPFALCLAAGYRRRSGRPPPSTSPFARSRPPMAITPLMPVYPRSPVRPVRGEGVYLYGEQGERYLDFAAGIAVNLLGHGHPRPDQGDPGPGGDADARVEPLRLAAGRGVRAAAGRPDLRRHGVLHQFGRRGGRVRDQDRAPLSLSPRAMRRSTTSSPSPTPSTGGRWRRSAPPTRRSCATASRRC